MKLEKRQEYKPQVSVKSTQSSNTVVKGKLDMQCECPNGKYKGRTLAWIKANDDWYWKWMEKENIHRSWGMIFQDSEDKPAKAKYSGYVDELNYQWLGIRIINEITTAAPQQWLQN